MDKYVKQKSLFQSFINAYSGLKFAFNSQLSLRIHFGALILVLILAIGFKINYYEWLILITVIAGVITLELFNTSLEQATDAITDKYNPIIKRAKDTSSSAVLIYALYSLIIAAMIFGSRMVSIFIK